MILLLFIEMVSVQMHVFQHVRSQFTQHSHYLSSGITVETPAGSMVARGILLHCSVDLPARAMICNMKQWNGAHGCLYCTEQGTTVGGDHLHRYWPYTISQPRSHTSFLQNAEVATRTGSPVCVDVAV